MNGLRCPWLAAGSLALLVVGCTPSKPEAGPAQDGGAGGGIVLVDATAGSGLDFVHTNGASAERLLPETMGSGVAVFDADADGLPDVLLGDGAPLRGGSTRSGAGLALYRNLAALRFENVTAASGLGYPGYAMGFAVGDVDGDGGLDVVVTGLRGERLFLHCRACHTLRPGEPHSVGPNLAGFFGRDAAMADGYAYSAALRQASLVWDDATLDRWLASPAALVPGTSMAFVGLADAGQRGALIAWLRTASAN